MTALLVLGAGAEVVVEGGACACVGDADAADAECACESEESLSFLKSFLSLFIVAAGVAESGV
jgi:hypothetical protein